MAQQYGGKIVTDGLKLNTDAATVDPTYAAFTNTNLYEGTIGAFAKPNGVQNEETLEFGLDPWGKSAILDRSLNNDTSSNYDGGFAQGYYTGVDHTKKYRFTYWSKVDETGTNGTLYFGLYGGNSSNSNVGVLRFDNGSNGTNPYFACPARSNYPVNKWIMHCYFAYPSGTSSGGTLDSDTGWYRMDTKTGPSLSGSGCNTGSGVIWNTTNDRFITRVYLYYCTDPNVKISWMPPRVDLVDGTEPTITQMLNYPPDRWDETAGRFNFQSKNAPTFSSSNGGYFDLNGSDQYFIGGDNSADLNLQTLSIQVWIKTDSLNQNGFWFEKGAVNTQYSLFQEGANLTFRTKTAGGSTSDLDYSSSNINTTDWWMITATYDGSNKRLYLNNELKSTVAYSSTINTDSNGMSIGAYGGTSNKGYYYNGKIAAVRVYNKALTMDEISANFNAQKGRFGL